jgi:hypothetical protein
MTRCDLRRANGDQPLQLLTIGKDRIETLDVPQEQAGPATTRRV